MFATWHVPVRAAAWLRLLRGAHWVLSHQLAIELECYFPVTPCIGHNYGMARNRVRLIVVTTVPSVRAMITLLPSLEGPRWPNRGRYMPHVVVGDPGQREAKISGNTITEHYLGVLVADAPDEIPPGGCAEITLRLMYWPSEPYDRLVPGASFTMREGPKIVGFGKVLSALV